MPLNRHKLRKLTHDDIDRMESLREQGYTYKRIAELIGCSASIVNYWLNEKTREYRRKYARERSVKKQAWKDPVLRETRKAEAKAWHLQNRESHLAQMLEYQKTHREVVQRANRKWQAEHREEINMKKRFGYLCRHLPLAEFCELCPIEDRRKAVKRYQPDYSMPLFILSLCNSCAWYARKTRLGLPKSGN